MHEIIDVFYGSTEIGGLCPSNCFFLTKAGTTTKISEECLHHFVGELVTLSEYEN